MWCIVRQTLRFNLDPFNTLTDDELRAILKRVRLHETSDQLALDSVIGENGGNLSFGQKQLICIARALLHKSRILLMDEATANVDSRLDALLQECIRELFAECTVITIAHRTSTIMDYDRIVVMDGGRIAEIGNPRQLLKIDSMFRALHENNDQ